MLSPPTARDAHRADDPCDIAVRYGLDLARAAATPGCWRLLGYEPDEWIGLSVVDTAYLDEAGAEWLRALRAVASGAAERGSAIYRLRHKTKHWVWVEETLRPERDADGRVTGVAGTIRDVSERLRQADELRLAKETAERALAAAQAASRAKTEFLAAMSHEIRTPLNAVIGFTNLLLDDGTFRPEDRRRLEIIQGAGAALLTVVNDILDFSKIEAGQIELEPRPFALPALIADTLALARGIAPAKSLAIEAVLDPGAPEAVVGDPDRLRQVLLNLLNNAVKFTPAGSVTLTVRREAGERLRFAVSDTGIGIASDKQGRLFQRFSQADGSIGRAFGGTGLGLAIARQLVVLMGGAIGFESTEGRGSTFWFTLPLPQPAAEPAAEPARPTARPAAAGGRVLVVEDVDINRDLLEAVLTRAGYAVDLAADGAEAVAAVRDRAYDVVLMDVQMPVMDGIAATQRIRALPGPQGRVPILALTATVLPEQVARFRAAGMDDNVAKPFQAGALLDTVARWTPAQDAAPTPEVPPLVGEPLFEDLAGLLGREKAQTMLARLAEEARRREPDGLGPPGPDLRQALEQACRVGAALGPYLERVDVARRAVQSEVGALKTGWRAGRA